MKIGIVLNESLGPGHLANAAACIASGLFNNEENLLGPGIEGKDVNYIPITKIAIMVFKQNGKSWRELLKRAKRKKLKYMLFTKEGQSTTSYEEYIERVKGKDIEEVEIIGLGVLGENIDSFCGDLSLLR